MTSAAIPPQLPLFTEQEREENERLIGELTEVIASREAVALVGAGSSVSAGYDSWDGLLRKLAQVAAECGAGFTPRENWDSHLTYAEEVRDHIVKQRGREYYQNSIARVFAREPALTPFHHDLVSLPFRGLLTTNYDLVLERAVAALPGSSEPVPVPVWNGDAHQLSNATRAISVADPVQHIIHLHGSYNQPPTVILSRSDYDEAYGFHDRTDASPGRHGPTRLWTILTSLLTTRRLVFIGFSLEDPYVTDVLGRVSDMLWEWDTSVHFALMPLEASRSREQRVRAQRLKERSGIDTVFYSATPSDHSERDVVIKRIASGLRITPQLPVPSPVREGAPGPVPEWVIANNTKTRARLEDSED